MLHTVVESFQKLVEIFGLICLSLTFCLPMNTIIEALIFKSFITVISSLF